MTASSRACYSPVGVGRSAALLLSERTRSAARRSVNAGRRDGEYAMAFQPVTDTAEIDIIFTEHGETLQSVFYGELSGGYILSDLAVLAAAVDAQVQGTWKSQMAIEVAYLRTEVRGLAVENDLVATNNTNAGVGVLVAGALPNNVTLAVKKESGLTGRSARGRTYWIGGTQDRLKSTNENEWTTGYVASVVAAVDSMRGAINAAGLWNAVLVSRFSGGLPRAFGKTFPWISSVAVNEMVDSQRGRLS